jgi:hypothetical protein
MHAKNEIKIERELEDTQLIRMDRYVRKSGMCKEKKKKKGKECERINEPTNRSKWARNERGRMYVYAQNKNCRFASASGGGGGGGGTRG